MLHFYVPPGIGDFSAMYQKLVHVDRPMTVHSSNDGPQRLGPFLDILKNVKNGGYAGHGANVALSQTLAPGTDLNSLPSGDYFLAINEWLESGGKVADWLPGPTEYHYMEKYTNNKEGLRIAQEFLIDIGSDNRPVVGVYCSAYGNARHWGFWLFEEWRKFLKLVMKIMPQNTLFLFLGAEYDLNISDPLHHWIESEGRESFLLLGAFPIGATIEVIRGLDYFFVFPSGLGFLADVVNTPNTMWFPNHLKPMMGTFVDPENWESQRTKHNGFDIPENAACDWAGYGYKHFEERLACRNLK